MGTPEIANSIAMSELTVPNLLVINSTTSHHHIPDDDPVLMTPEAVSLFLDQIHLQLAPVSVMTVYIPYFYSFYIIICLVVERGCNFNTPFVPV